jgi:hypothetical protein
MHPPDPFPPPAARRESQPRPRRRQFGHALARHGITGIYTASAEKFAVISVTAALTVWTNGRHIWYTHDGQRRTWPATRIEAAATRLATLARAPKAP